MRALELAIVAAVALGCRPVAAQDATMGEQLFSRCTVCHDVGPRAQNRVDALALNLAHLGPQAVLARGYAIVTTADATVVQDATQLAPGDDVTLTFARGRAGARVTSRE